MTNEEEVTLTQKDVDDIRKLWSARKFSQVKLAEMYKVDKGHIRFILNRNIKAVGSDGISQVYDIIDFWFSDK